MAITTSPIALLAFNGSLVSGDSVVSRWVLYGDARKKTKIMNTKNVNKKKHDDHDEDEGK